MTDESTGAEISTEFRAWLDNLNAAAKARGYPGADTFWQDRGHECWLAYFEDGDTPEDALAQDETHE